jgi:hypothetical protein
MHDFRRAFTSRTNWEGSFYGKDEKLIQDLPYIVADNVDIEIDNYNIDKNETTIPYYTREKLVKLLFNEGNKMGFNKVLFDLEHWEEITHVKYYTTTKKALKLKQKSLIRYFDAICSTRSDSELKNLFKNNKEIILHTDFIIDIEETEDGKDSDKKNLNTIKKAIFNIKEYEKVKSNYFGYSSSSLSSSSTEKYIPVIRGASSFTANSLVDYNSEIKNNERNEQSCLSDYSLPLDFINIQSRTLKRLLDITFDKQQYYINNLKNGKLDENKISELISGNINIFKQKKELTNTKPFSVCIIGDESGSMGGRKIAVQRILFKILHDAFDDILPYNSLFMYGFASIHRNLILDSDGITSNDISSYEQPSIRIYKEKSLYNFEEQIKSMGDSTSFASGCNNYDGPSVEGIYKRVRDITDDNVLCLVLSDGDPAGENYGGIEDRNKYKQIIEKMRRDNFVCVGIGIQSSAVKHFFPNNFVVNDLSNLHHLVMNIINKVVKSEFQ